jgi:hypothetical protein
MPNIAQVEGSGTASGVTLPSMARLSLPRPHVPETSTKYFPACSKLPNGVAEPTTADSPPNEDGAETMPCSIRPPRGMSGETPPEVQVEGQFPRASRNLVHHRSGERHRSSDIFGGWQRELEVILEHAAGSRRLRAGKRDAVVQSGRGL